MRRVLGNTKLKWDDEHEVEVPSGVKVDNAEPYGFTLFENRVDDTGKPDLETACLCQSMFTVDQVSPCFGDFFFDALFNGIFLTDHLSCLIDFLTL